MDEELEKSSFFSCPKFSHTCWHTIEYWVKVLIMYGSWRVIIILLLYPSSHHAQRYAQTAIEMMMRLMYGICDTASLLSSVTEKNSHFESLSARACSGQTLGFASVHPCVSVLCRAELWFYWQGRIQTFEGGGANRKCGAKSVWGTFDRSLICDLMGQPWPGGGAMAPFAPPLYPPLKLDRF